MTSTAEVACQAVLVDTGAIRGPSSRPTWQPMPGMQGLGHHPCGAGQEVGLEGHGVQRGRKGLGGAVDHPRAPAGPTCTAEGVRAPASGWGQQRHPRVAQQSRKTLPPGLWAGTEEGVGEGAAGVCEEVLQDGNLDLV